MKQAVVKRKAVSKAVKRSATRQGYVLGRAVGEKIMAVEGLALSEDDQLMFAEFDRLGLSPEERRRRLIALLTRDSKAD